MRLKQSRQFFHDNCKCLLDNIHLLYEIRVSDDGFFCLYANEKTDPDPDPSILYSFIQQFTGVNVKYKENDNFFKVLFTSTWI